MIIKQGLVHTMSSAGTFVADIEIEDGKIARIGQNLDGETVIDAQGLHVFPGMIESHCHLGLEESSIGFEGMDINETSDPITPQMRAIDAVNPMDETVYNALAAGVTTVAAGSGSANVVGGTWLAYKTAGHAIDKMVVQDPIAMKSAFGENPKRVYRDGKIKTRMGIASLMRDLLSATKEYMEKKEAAGNDPLKKPSYDRKLEAMIPVLKGELTMKCHAHRADDILTSIRIAKEYGIKISLDHCTDGANIVEEIKESGFPAIVGPSLTHKTKFELASKSFKTPAILHKAGILIAITTDSPVIPQEYLPLCAALAMKDGLPEQAALEAITINPAKILGLEDRLGSIEVGKDADLVICTDSLLETQNRVKYTLVNGKVAFEG